jgi:hypothetical protein
MFDQGFSGSCPMPGHELADVDTTVIERRAYCRPTVPARGAWIAALEVKALVCCKTSLRKTLSAVDDDMIAVCLICCRITKVSLGHKVMTQCAQCACEPQFMLLGAFTLVTQLQPAPSYAACLSPWNLTAPMAADLQGLQRLGAAAGTASLPTGLPPVS